MATIGADCDIALAHAAVNGGEPIGFILHRNSPRGGAVTIRRQAYTTPDDGSYSDRVRWWMTIAAIDNAQQPNGALSADTRSNIYANILLFLAQRTGITLLTAAGTYVDLYATLTVTLEHHWITSSGITLQLNNGAFTQTAPIDTTRFNNSMWDGSLLTWDTSYWR